MRLAELLHLQDDLADLFGGSTSTTQAAASKGHPWNSVLDNIWALERIFDPVVECFTSGTGF